MKIAIAGSLIASAGLLLWVAHSPAQPTLKTDEIQRVLTTVDGPTLYNEYCAVCHGISARGDGPMAPMLNAKTPDLTRIAMRHGGKFPRARVEDVISGEAQLPAGHGTREMPIWGPAFSQVDRDVDLGRVRIDNVARYLETLQEK